MVPDNDRKSRSGETPSIGSEAMEEAEIAPRDLPAPDQSGGDAVASPPQDDGGTKRAQDDVEGTPPFQGDGGRIPQTQDEGEEMVRARDEGGQPLTLGDDGVEAPSRHEDEGGALSPQDDDEGEPPDRYAVGQSAPSTGQTRAPGATASARNPATEQALPAGPTDVMPLMEHLRELRTRLLRGILALLVTTAASFAFTKQVLTFLIAPMGDTLPQALKPTESIGNYMKVALLCGVTLAMPVLVYQIGRFVSPALTKEEKRQMRPYLLVLVPGATLFFVGGIAFAYFVMLPTAIPFLQGFLADIIEQQWAIGEYLSFVTSLLFWIGVAFEMPLFVFFLAKTGVIDAKMLSRNRKYAILIMAVLAAVITPTVDPVNMLLVMGPLILLYELGVVLARFA